MRVKDRPFELLLQPKLVSMTKPPYKFFFLLLHSFRIGLAEDSPASLNVLKYSLLWPLIIAERQEWH